MKLLFMYKIINNKIKLKKLKLNIKI